jgi:hypothetical protein
VLQHLGAICLAIAAQQAQPWLLGPLDRTSVVNGNILNSRSFTILRVRTFTN